MYKVGPETSTIEYLFYSDQGGAELLGPSPSEEIVLRREIIIDRRTQLPIEVNAYNGAGLRIMHSELKNYTAVGEDKNRGQSARGGRVTARLPKDILLRWDQQDAQLRLKLSGIKPDIKLDKKKLDILFTRPETVSDLKSYEQIDKACDEAQEGSPASS